MRKLAVCFALLLAIAGARAAEMLPLEQQVAEAVKSPKVTVVHFWATWCPNCRAELAGNGWSKFVNKNRDAQFIFVTVRDEKSGGPELAKFGLEKQKNFTHLQHPNSSRLKGQEMISFMGQPVGWIPTTWIYRDGKLRYALNYGEVRFPILQQLVDDAQPKWDK